MGPSGRSDERSVRANTPKKKKKRRNKSSRSASSAGQHNSDHVDEKLDRVDEVLDEVDGELSEPRESRHERSESKSGASARAESDETPTGISDGETVDRHDRDADDDAKPSAYPVADTNKQRKVDDDADTDKPDTTFPRADTNKSSALDDAKPDQPDTAFPKADIIERSDEDADDTDANTDDDTELPAADTTPDTNDTDTNEDTDEPDTDEAEAFDDLGSGFTSFDDRPSLSGSPSLRAGDLEPLYEAVRLILARPGGTPDGNLPTRIAAVSPLPGDGATTIAQVFASVLSNDFGIETCYVDLSWGSTTKPGVFEVVMGTAELEDVLEWDGMTAIINSGDVSPAERHRLARSEILDKLIAELAGRFQYVVLDLPAILSGSDGLAMMRLVDGYVLVVRHGQTTLRQVQITTSQLTNVTLLGTVLNHVRRRTPRSLRRWLTE